MMRSKLVRSNGACRATTLIELTVTIAIMAVVMAAVLPLLSAIRKTSDNQTDAAQARQNGRVLAQKIYSELITAHCITSVSNPTDSTGYIEYEDDEGQTKRFDINSSTNYVQYGVRGDQSDLAGPVSQLQFTCYDIDDLDTPTTEPNSIRYVKVATTVTGPDGTEENFPLTLEAFLRTEVCRIAIAVSDSMDIHADSQIKSFNAPARVATNSTSNDKIKVRDRAILDGDAFAGPGGDPASVIKIDNSGQILGTLDALDSEISISAPTIPSMSTSVGDVTSSVGTTTIDADLHCNKFEFSGSAILEVTESVSILVDDNFKIKDLAQLQILGDATLTLYCRKDFIVEGYGQANANTATPSRMIVYHFDGSRVLKVQHDGVVYAKVVAPDSKLELKDDAQMYGTYRGRQLNTDKFSIFWCGE